MSRMTTLEKKTRTSARRANRRASAAVSPVAADARDTAARYAEATRDWAAPRVETARDWAAPRVETAVEWAAPRVEPAVDKVRTEVLPAVAGAVATALAATEPARTEAANRGTAALAALKGELDPPPRNRHRVRKLFLLTVLLGGAYAAYRAWMARSSDPVDAWTTPVKTPTPASSMGDVSVLGTPGSDDPAGASPDEALADATAEPAPADDATTVIEAVSAEQADKVSEAAAKGGHNG